MSTEQLPLVMPQPCNMNDDTRNQQEVKWQWAGGMGSWYIFKTFSIVLIANYIPLLQVWQHDEEWGILLVMLNTLFWHGKEGIPPSHLISNLSWCGQEGVPSWVYKPMQVAGYRYRSTVMYPFKTHTWHHGFGRFCQAPRSQMSQSLHIHHHPPPPLYDHRHDKMSRTWAPEHNDAEVEMWGRDEKCQTEA